MTRHPRGSAAALAALLLAGPVPAWAQAWVPPKGEGTVTILFTNVLSKDHFLPDTRVDIGHIDSNTLLLEVAYGVTDRLAVSAGLPFVSSRYRGNFPHRPITLDDGAWHTSPQDMRFALRFNAARSPLVLTLFAGTELPSRAYEFYAHAAPGRQLKELHLGIVSGRLFADLGIAVQGRYSLALSERALEDYPRRYSLAAAEVAYFVTPALRLIGTTSARIGHTGIDLFLTSGRDLPSDVFLHHDRIGREGYWNVAGGAAISVTDRLDLFGSVTRTISGRNTHAVNRGVSVGIGWSFGQAAALVTTRGERAPGRRSRAALRGRLPA